MSAKWLLKLMKEEEKKAIKRGMAKGMEKGIEKGRQKERESLFAELITAGLLTKEQVENYSKKTVVVS